MSNNLYFKANKKRWLLLPGGRFRVSIKFLNQLPVFLLKLVYDYFCGFWKKERAWEHEKYIKYFESKDVLEIGAGMGYDAMQYVNSAKSYTCGELNFLQINFLSKVFGIYNKDIKLEYLENPIQHKFSRKFNAFYAHGVLHHVPFELAKQQFQNIDKYLESGSIVVFLMYPKERWEHCGKPSFEEFGKFTDGGCPWAEWYDDKKIKDLVGDGYVLNYTIKWGWNNIEFVNFELVKK
jgi:hypothetical protein